MSASANTSVHSLMIFLISRQAHIIKYNVKKSKVILTSTFSQLGEIIVVPPLKINLTKVRTTRPLVQACVMGRKLLILINIYFM